MRISSAQLHEAAVAQLMSGQTRLARTQQQIASGRRVLTPADDPAAAMRTLELLKSRDATAQYQKNAEHAETRLTLEETTLASAGDSLQRVRELAVRANNDTLDAASRAAIADEVRQIRDQLLGLANTRDANGDYLFSGYRVHTVPIVSNGAGAYTYQGDDGVRRLQIGAERSVAIGDPGDEIFMNLGLGTGNGDIFSALDNFAGALDANNPDPAILDDLDTSLSRVLETRSQIGARLNAIENQTSVNADFILAMDSALSEIGDLDYAEAISRFEREMLSLEAAQKSYSRLSELSLFNYL